MTRSPARILLVEDDAPIRQALEVAFRGEGYEVWAEADGNSIEKVIERFRPDLAILDVRLPSGRDGFDLARVIRMQSDTALLFLTAADSLQDRLAGFETGADDYVVKPYDMRELLARIHAVSRRAGSGGEPVASEAGLGTPVGQDSPRGNVGSRLRIGAADIDLSARRVTVEGNEVALTRKEFDLLELLAGRPGVVFRREQIISAVWRSAWAGTGRTLEVHIASLRAKLGLPALIETVRGVGYRLSTAPREGREGEER
jgi:DNA-binding response OmpR family regulator